MTDEKNVRDDMTAGGETPAKRAKTKRPLVVAAVVVAVLAVAGVGMWKWHEMPSFCSTICHVEGTYVANYEQPQNAAGVDKYGNQVSNTNAMMAVLHRETKATAKSEMVCVDCHIPNMQELAHDGINYVTGNYPYPRDERSGSDLMKWDGKDSTQLCSNENCHVNLLGDDGVLSLDKLEASSASQAFNPHSQHHEGLSLECTSCHKGHRASTVVCTGCHEHQDVALPDGWVTYDESTAIMKAAMGGI